MFGIEQEPHSMGDIGMLQHVESDGDERDSPDFVGGAVSVACQEHENDAAEVVLVCEPEGASISMGGLHPRASLFERPVNLEASKRQHANFRETLRSYGLKDKCLKARMQLEDLAMEALTYKLNREFVPENLTTRDLYSLSDTYKREVLEEMSLDQLIDVLMVRPTVELTPTDSNTGMEAKYEYQPLANLLYTRDQQITTARGVVMGRLKSTQRHAEVDLLKFCLDKIGIKVLGSVKEPGYLEGGDFFPAGPELCFVGIGLRSNLQACQQLMDSDWLGTDRVAVVKDDFDQNQDRMHLDCVFNIVGANCCLMLEDVVGENSRTRRLVDEYRRDRLTRRYELVDENVEFGAYVRSKGYKIVPISGEDQLNYGINVLNLGHGQLLSVNSATSRKILRSTHFEGRIEAVDFSSITSMYGAAHCSTQVLKRRTQKTQTPSISSKFNSLRLDRAT